MLNRDCAGLDEAQARIKIAGRNINNLRYADDTTLRAESEEGHFLLQLTHLDSILKSIEITLLTNGVYGQSTDFSSNHVWM